MFENCKLKPGEIYRIHPPGSPEPHDYIVLSEPDMVDCRCIMVNFSDASKFPKKGRKEYDQKDAISVNGDFTLSKKSVLRYDWAEFECHKWVARNNGKGPLGICTTTFLRAIQKEFYAFREDLKPVVRKRLNSHHSNWK